MDEVKVANPLFRDWLEDVPGAEADIVRQDGCRWALGEGDVGADEPGGWR